MKEFKEVKWVARHETKEFCDTGDYEYYATIDDENGKCIAQFFNKDEDLREKECNLAASAPELAKALQEAIELFESAYTCMENGDNEGLYNALANATSRSNFKEVLIKAIGE